VTAPITSVSTPGTAAGVAGGEVAAPAAPLVITVYGTPVTQGSKTRNRYGGVRDDNASTLRPWREAVKQAALALMPGRERLTGPVSVTATFAFDRPQGHYGTGRNAGRLRDSAPPTPANRGSGDLDKLLRAAFDSLSDAGVWRDDSQVVWCSAEKVWAGDPLHEMHIPGAFLILHEVTR